MYHAMQCPPRPRSAAGKLSGIFPDPNDLDPPNPALYALGFVRRGPARDGLFVSKRVSPEALSSGRQQSVCQTEAAVFVAVDDGAEAPGRSESSASRVTAAQELSRVKRRYGP